jgi:hypothetical protein
MAARSSLSTFRLAERARRGVTIKETATPVKGTLAETFLTIQVTDKKWFVCEAVLPENIKPDRRLTPKFEENGGVCEGAG